MNKIIISILIAVNIWLLYKYIDIESKSAPLHLYKKQERELHKIKKGVQTISEDFNQVLQLSLPDTLRKNYILFFPQDVCNSCADSILIQLKAIHSKNSDFSFYIGLSNNSIHLKRFVKFHKIPAKIIIDNSFSSFYKSINNPILTYYSGEGHFLNTLPIYKHYMIPFNKYLKSIEDSL